MSGPSPAVKDQIVRAGAGAGKTTALVRKVLDLVQQARSNGTWPRLVVTTFTRKATQELRERLTAEACLSGDLELLEYCRSRSRLHISTIHGVLSMFLRRYGHLVGVDPSYSILTENGVQQLRRSVLRDLLKEHGSALQLLEIFNLKKLESMLDGYLALLNHRQMPRAITVQELEQIFKREAAEWSTQTLTLVDSIRPSAEKAGTEYLEYLQTLGLILKDGNWQDLQGLIEAWPKKPAARGGKSALGGWDEDVTTHKKRLQAWAQDEANNPKMWEKFVSVSKTFQPLADEYSQVLKSRKLNQGLLQMNDLEDLALSAIREHPEVAKAFAADWDFWLVDEFQDTSPIQVELLERLSFERPQYLVGDPQQSIYLFRGARSEVFAQTEDKIKNEGGEYIELMRNYRSHPSLLSFMNDFLKSVGTFMPLDPRHTKFQTQEPVARLFPAPEGQGALWREPEYLFLVEQIQALALKPQTELSDICILARKNRTLFQIAQFLKSFGIPTHVHASRGYFERLEVRDALALLKFLVVPQDNRALMDILRSPWCRIVDDELVGNLKRGATPFWQQILSGPLAKNKIVQELQAFQTKAAEVGYSHAWELALVQFGFFDFSGHNDSTGRREANLWKLVTSLALAERRPGFQILEFINQGRQQRADTESADEGDAVTAVEPNVVNLMTIHAAKGLERKHVLIPHCDEGLKAGHASGLAALEEENAFCLSAPGEDGSLVTSPVAQLERKIRSIKELAEQDRLLYVALTRAQESLCLSWTGAPDKNSWAGRWKWPTHQVGVQTHPQYTYEIVAATSTPVGRWEKADKSSAVRSKFNMDQFDGKPVSSVVNLIDQGGTADSKSTGRDSVPDFVGRAVKGTSFHRLLEQARLNPQGINKSFIQAWFPNEAEAVQKAYEYVLGLKSPPMSALLREGFAEWGFQLETDHLILEGQIDLWGIVDDTVWVLDYKSGNPQYVEKAMRQLEVYAHALRAFGHQQPIQLAVIYPFGSKVEIKEFKGDLEKAYPLLARTKSKFGGAHNASQNHL